jgi:hypothetical protein
MRDVAEITVTQIRVYATDQLPFQALRLPANLRNFGKVFNFEGIGLDPIGLQVTLSNGAVEIEKQSIHILNLTVEPRRMLLVVRGRTSDANAAASSISIELARLTPDSSKQQTFQPILVTNETTCVATLDIDFSHLVAAPVMSVIEEEAKTMLSNKYMLATWVGFKNLSFEIRYDPVDDTLQEHDIALANKLLTLEPRLGTPLKERRFYISSPTDSETHLALVEALESRVSKHRRDAGQSAT